MLAEKLRDILNRDHVVKMKGGAEHITLKGLLVMAHAYGMTGIDVDIIQVAHPSNNMRAVVKVTAHLKSEGDDKEQLFSATGDADPETCGKIIAYERMAETRALSRALRFALNWGDVTAEELNIEVADRPASAPSAAPRPQAAAATGPAAADASGDGDNLPMVCSTCSVALTKGQFEISRRNLGRPLCPAHQKAA